MPMLTDFIVDAGNSCLAGNVLRHLSIYETSKCRLEHKRVQYGKWKPFPKRIDQLRIAGACARATQTTQATSTFEQDSSRPEFYGDRFVDLR